VPPYIVDFFCVSLALVVELDGSQHTPDVDSARSKFLESRGLSILRFWDHDVLIHTNEVLTAILEFAENRTHAGPSACTPTGVHGLAALLLESPRSPPIPLPEGEGLKSDAP
jgi:hypothetical protein